MNITRIWARLYTNQTEPEKRMEPAIAALGRPYRCQHPFWKLHHFADFALLQDKVIIEVDGKSHQAPAQRLKDLKHTLALQEMGWTVVRCSNEEALSDPHGTVAQLLTPESLAASLLDPAETLLESARLAELIATKKTRRSPRPRPARVAKGRRKSRPALLDATRL